MMDLWKIYPLTIMENVTNISQNCKTAYGEHLRKLYQNDLNAAKMFDATAKLPSGILRGNVNQYGDFEECMELDSASYCLAEINIEPLWRQPYLKFSDLVHAHLPIQETLDDPKHRVPGFTMIRWGFCIPIECSNKDLENAIQEKLGVQSRIKRDMCQQTKNKLPITYGDIIARSFFLSIMMAVIFSTYLYNRVQPDAKSKWLQILMCFSLQKNVREIITAKENTKEIQAVHGVRALSALALIISHKVMALYYNPYMNRTPMMESFNMKWSVIGRTAILYTECFMLLSGLLNANSLFADLDRTKTMRLIDKIITRLFSLHFIYLDLDLDLDGDLDGDLDRDGDFDLDLDLDLERELALEADFDRDLDLEPDLDRDPDLDLDFERDFDLCEEFERDRERDFDL
ncbi:hypothetical protein NQ317_006719 [Molorchus minor]|uniref:Nose resistant-to-fluoxetine protein N-terminal domain-containing protein n=1 Tax=Molorchus minor TaxID=1323400 RepID=A0ABQ9K335_9CUCU|nr:hypothetical protein NQ317_006719 [Molorchus minor]